MPCFKARWEGHSEAAVADAVRRAQRLLDALLARRLESG
jgi:hypothetical protein